MHGVNVPMRQTRCKSTKLFEYDVLIIFQQNRVGPVMARYFECWFINEKKLLHTALLDLENQATGITVMFMQSAMAS